MGGGGGTSTPTSLSCTCIYPRRTTMTQFDVRVDVQLRALNWEHEHKLWFRGHDTSLYSCWEEVSPLPPFILSLTLFFEISVSRLIDERCTAEGYWCTPVCLCQAFITSCCSRFHKVGVIRQWRWISQSSISLVWLVPLVNYSSCFHAVVWAAPFSPAHFRSSVIGCCCCLFPFRFIYQRWASGYFSRLRLSSETKWFSAKKGWSISSALRVMKKKVPRAECSAAGL